jgi:hypothetical protein
MWSLGYKWRHAFLLSIAGEAIWTVIAYQRSNYELATICLIFCLVAGRNWWKWGSGEKVCNCVRMERSRSERSGADRAN